jgi:hypothetical protein
MDITTLPTLVTSSDATSGAPSLNKPCQSNLYKPYCLVDVPRTSLCFPYGGRVPPKYLKVQSTRDPHNAWSCPRLTLYSSQGMGEPMNLTGSRIIFVEEHTEASPIVTRWDIEIKRYTSWSSNQRVGEHVPRSPQLVYNDPTYTSRTLISNGDGACRYIRVNYVGGTSATEARPFPMCPSLATSLTILRWQCEATSESMFQSWQCPLRPQCTHRIFANYLHWGYVSLLSCLVTTSSLKENFTNIAEQYCKILYLHNKHTNQIDLYMNTLHHSYHASKGAIDCSQAFFCLPGRRRWLALISPHEPKTNLGVLFCCPQGKFQGPGEKVQWLIGWLP